METALRISYQGGTPSEALNSLINDHVETLEKIHGRLTSCQVIVQVPDRHHRTSNLFSVNIHIALPGHIDVNIDHMSHDDERFADPTFAVNDAFLRRARGHLFLGPGHDQAPCVVTVRFSMRFSGVALTTMRWT